MTGIRLADRMARLGTESAFEVLARARAIEDAGGKIIHLEIGEPDFPTAPHIVEAAVGHQVRIRARQRARRGRDGGPAGLQAGLLKDAGVAALSGAAFGPCGEGYLRLSYANSVENIRSALDAIRAQLS